jgi:putative heme-binding domain-containing protein
VRDQLLCAALRIDRDNGNEFFFDPFDLLKSEVNGVESTLALAKTKDIDRALSYCGATPAARRELLITIRALEPHFAASVFYPLAKLYDGQDHFYRAALNIACGTDPKRRAAILADFNKHFPEWNDKVADLVWELRPKSVLPRLEKLLADAKLSDAQKGRIVDILAVNDDPAAGKSLLALLRSNPPAAVRDRALENLRLFLPTKWKGLAGGPEMKQIIVELLARDETRVIGLQLIAVDRRPEWAEMAGAIALDKQAPAALRGEAIRTLGKLKALGNVALDDAELAPAAIEAIGRHLVAGNRDSDAANLALKFLQEVILLEKLTPESRAALSALGGSQAGSAWLLNQKERGLLPEALAADTGRLLRNSPFQPIRNKAMLLFPPPGKLDPAKLPAIPVLAKRTGDVGRGKRLLAASVKSEAQCLKCHTIRGVGGQIGPDLSMIGKKASRENLLESILLPSKAIADQYLQYQIETKSGQQVMGLIVAQDASAVTLRDANGKDYTFNRRDIESMTKSQVSIMPADIVKALSEDELLDVVEYLLTLRTPSLTPEFWHIVGPFPNDEKDSGLDTVYEPEKKVDLSATYKASRERQRPENARQRPELTWTKVTRNADGYVDLVAHYAGHSVNIMSYVYREIEAPADGEATISLGTDDGAKLWVNGEKVYETRAHDAATPDKAKVTVKLKKGVNTLLMKIVNGNNPHGFYLTIVSEQELKAGK